MTKLCYEWFEGGYYDGVIYYFNVILCYHNDDGHLVLSPSALKYTYVLNEEN